MFKYRVFVVGTIVVLVLVGNVFATQFFTVKAALTTYYHCNMNSENDITNPVVGPVSTRGSDLTVFPSGHTGNATDFNQGVNAYIQIPNDGITVSGGQLRNELMWELWWQPDYASDEDLAQTEYFIHQRSDSGNKFNIYRWVDENFRFKVYDENNIKTEIRIYVPDFAWSQNDWIHMRAWYDADLTENNMKIWLYNENTNTGFSKQVNFDKNFSAAGTHDHFFIGNDHGAAAQYVRGSLDEFKIYDSIDGSPAITSLSSSSARAGETITVYGTNFLDQGGFSKVEFNGVEASIESWSDTEISVTVPISTDGNVVVTTYVASSSGQSFTYLPTISYAQYAAAIDTLYLEGSGFKNPQGGSTVTTNGTNLGNAAYWSENYIYFQNVSEISSNTTITVNGSNYSKSIDTLSTYLQYPNDPDIANANLVSYWPMNDNFDDVKGDNDFVRRELRPASGGIFGSSFRGDQMMAGSPDYFPSNATVFKLINTGEYLLVYDTVPIGGGGHNFVDRKVYAMRSSDGVNWGEPYQIAEQIIMAGNSALITSDGIIFLFAKEGGDYATAGVNIYRSTDNGYTFNLYSSLPLQGWPTQRAFGRGMELDDGTLLKTSLGNGGANSIVYLYASTDEGKTWVNRGIIHNYRDANEPSANLSGDILAGAVTIPTNVDLYNAGFSSGPGYADINDDLFFYNSISGQDFTGVTGVEAHSSGAEVVFQSGVNETNIVKAPDDNNLLAVTRSELLEYPPLISYSTDQGATWSRPTPLHAEDGYAEQWKGIFVHKYSGSNRIFLTVRGVQYWYSDDNGANWIPGGNSTIFPSESNYSIDIVSYGDYQGYGSFVEENDGRIAFYYNLEGWNNPLNNWIIKKNHIDPTTPIAGHYMTATDDAVPGVDSLAASNYSLSFWLKLDHYIGVKQMIMAKRKVHNSFWHSIYMVGLTDGENPKIVFGFDEDSDVISWTESTISLQKDSWYHISLTYDGSQRKIFINGVLDAVETVDLTNNIEKNCPFVLGLFSYDRCRQTDYKSFRTGTIDNLKFFNDAMTYQEILAQANYSAPVISSVSPSSADKGANIAVSGSNFGSSQVSNSITIGGVSPVISSWSENQIQITIPTNVNNGNNNIVVTINGNNSNSYSYQVGVAPVISAVSAQASQNSAAITWLSDESSNSKVNYWKSDGSQSSITNSAMTTSHSVALTSLESGTQYYYQVYSSDQYDSTSSSNTYTFNTTSGVVSVAGRGKVYARESTEEWFVWIENVDGEKEELLEDQEIIIYTSYPKFSGIAKPNSRLEIAINGDNFQKTYIVYCDADGKWELLIEDELKEGSYYLQITETDENDNTRVSPKYKFRIAGSKDSRDDNYSNKHSSILIVIGIVSLLVAGGVIAKKYIGSKRTR